MICKTPGRTEASQSPSASEKAQKHKPARGASANAPRSVSEHIDEEPFRLSPNHSSTEDLCFFSKAAFDAVRGDNEKEEEEEAELGRKDASSCSNHLLSPTHVGTNEIGHKLASFYATKRHFVDAYDMINWMTNKHLGNIGTGHLETMEHVFRIISLLRCQLRNEQAGLPTYCLPESLQSPVEHPVMTQISTGHETVSEGMIGELLAPADEGTLAVLLVALEDLASDSQNHEFLQKYASNNREMRQLPANREQSCHLFQMHPSRDSGR